MEDIRPDPGVPPTEPEPVEGGSRAKGPGGLKGFLERMKGASPFGEDERRENGGPDGQTEPTERGSPAGIEDIRIRRDEDGHVVPLVVTLPTVEIQVKLKPFTFGFWRSVLDEAASFRELDLDQKAAMIQECVIPVDRRWGLEYPGGLTPEILERDFDAQTVDDLVWACWEYSNARRREGYPAGGKATASGDATSDRRRTARPSK